MAAQGLINLQLTWVGGKLLAQPPEFFHIKWVCDLVQDTHVTIAAPIPEPMMDPWTPGDVRVLVGDGDSTIGRFVGEERHATYQLNG